MAISGNVVMRIRMPRLPIATSDGVWLKQRTKYGANVKRMMVAQLQMMIPVISAVL